MSSTPEPDPQLIDKATILLVEDSHADIRLIQEALKSIRVPSELHIARTGEEAMRWLREESATVGRPDLILLDLNLPKKDGREVLGEIKSDEDLKLIPVVVMTSSEAQEDIIKSYALHANAYVKKPLGLKALHQVLRDLESFWFKAAQLPSQC